MESLAETKLLEQVENWCDHCQSYVAKQIIWKAEPDTLIKLSAVGIEALYHKVLSDNLIASIKSVYKDVPPHYLRNIRNALNELLENKVSNEPFES